MLKNLYVETLILLRIYAFSDSAYEIFAEVETVPLQCMRINISIYTYIEYSETV